MTDYAFNFRGSLGYVTDISPAAFFGAITYPTAVGGLNVGYITSLGALTTVDRNSGVDARFAGFHYVGPSTTSLQIDLPSTGAWVVHLALGDPNGAMGTRRIRVYDNATNFIDFTTTTSGASKYRDATNVERTSEADWVTNSVGVARTFATTSLIVTLGDGSTEGEISHLFLTPAGGPVVGGSGIGLYSPRGTTQPVARGWA